MPTTPGNGMDRRRFLMGAATGALVGGAGASSSAATAPIKPIELPEKVLGTKSSGISEKTHEDHYEIYKSYVASANALAGRLSVGAAHASDQYSDFRGARLAYAEAIGAVRAHELFFNSIGGRVSDPDGQIAEAISDAFGSYRAWRADMKAVALASRGWAWVELDLNSGALLNQLSDSDAAFPATGASALLAMDMAEHAYYLDFGPDRSKYVDALFDVIDWSAANDAFKIARTAHEAVHGAR